MAAEGKLNMIKINSALKDGFDKVDNTLANIIQDNNKMSADILEIRNEIIKNLIETNKKLQLKIETLQQNVHSLEEKLSCEINQTNQYGRRNNIEVCGVPNEINDCDLEDEVVEIFNCLNVDVEKNDIEACHRLPPSKKSRNKKVIVRFTNRKFAEKILKSKKELANMYRHKNKIFINENLNKHFQKLAWRCRSLKKAMVIHSYKFQNESFQIKVSAQDRSKKIISERELFNLFPDFFASLE